MLSTLGLDISQSVDGMSKADWACVILMILGIIDFLVGANIYNAVVGWLGVFFFVGGLAALVILYVRNKLVKRPVQNP